MRNLEGMRSGWLLRAWGGVIAGLCFVSLGAVSCGSPKDTIRASVIREKAVGTWLCNADGDSGGSQEGPFLVTVDAGGTFAVTKTNYTEMDAMSEHRKGSWRIEDGDLRVEGDEIATLLVPDVEEQRLKEGESAQIGADRWWPESQSGPKPAPFEFKVLSENHVSIKGSYATADTWTCRRQ